ncbi:RNase A-like domain-containing protein [Priestia sp. GS2]|uniref:RNase A-like domain-containing protein n=1 Tax=Priestia sp. GS2 TaxID=3117403 RepID=UPI002ED92C2A
MVQHPVETAESIGEGVKAVWDDPKGVAKTIGNEIKDSWNEQVINGDAKSRGHYFSYLTANVVMSIVGTKGADKLAKTTKLEQLSGAATKKLNEGAAAINVRTQSALQNLGLNKLDNRLAYPGVGSVKGNGGYQFIERVDGGNGGNQKTGEKAIAKGIDDVKPGDTSSLAPGGGLAAHELKGGHLIERHVGKTDEELLESIKNNPRINGSSTFTDRATAEKVASKVLNNSKNIEKIQKWLSDSNSRPKLQLKYQGDGEIIGKSVSRNSEVVENVTNAKIILKKSNDGNFILTGYPVK